VSAVSGQIHDYWLIPLPSGKHTKTYGKSSFSGKIDYKLQFSIAMLVYQRVHPQQISYLSHQITVRPVLSHMCHGQNTVFFSSCPPTIIRHSHGTYGGSPSHAGPPDYPSHQTILILKPMVLGISDFKKPPYLLKLLVATHLCHLYHHYK